MRIKAAVLATLLGLSITPAGAQSRWGDYPAYYEGLPTRVIMRIVRSRGFEPVSRPLRRGEYYVVNAVDFTGRERHVIIDAYSGGIVRVQAGRLREYRGAGRFDDGGDLTPPRRIPRSAAIDRGDDDDEDFRGSARRSLPPLRPRAVVPDAPPAVIGRPDSEGALPPPPRPERHATRPPADAPAAAPRERRATAKPPAPRPRPQAALTPSPESSPALAGDTLPQANSDASAPAQANGEKEGAAARAKPKRLPRIVLPGGPLPKAQRTADTKPGQRIAAEAPAQAAADNADDRPTGSTSAPPASPAAEMPPVQPLE